MTDAALETVAVASISLPRSRSERATRVASGVAGVAALALGWEAYKAVGPADGGSVLGLPVLPRSDDSSMPHVWHVLAVMGDPEVSAPGASSVGSSIAGALLRTGAYAVAGCLLGALVGLLLAVVMQRLRWVEEGLLPYVVLSQTVPLVALAPLVVGIGRSLPVPGGWQPWMSVTVVAAYLAFFPVAVGALRGLQSAPAASVELFRSIAATPAQTLLRLRLPAAVPYLVPAARLAAAASVVGAVVAEISTGTKGGIGRLIIAYAQQASTDPARVYAAVLAAGLLGLVLTTGAGLLELALPGDRDSRGGRR
ncbi:NitT/TauT family transport system permease protein [Motilibacter rhizosphaerae]|uniref:NitT/TauT family transport system permease protein n=1 Tax=Motilibacter rhizosphaerae TaxID=598652 RepID=A0A4Q7NV38_9ACTN|nr:ABC transporter permease subunit [Motilibacter rhizosphaerae]RZS91091.1 NitT/TauT family transport system permease protein [Motilibacter rhizosphaerae]